MVSEDFEVEEWDADFLDQLVEAEEIALSTKLHLMKIVYKFKEVTTKESKLYT